MRGGWLKEAIDGYRWLWRAQQRWRPRPRWLAGLWFLGRVITDLARAPLPPKQGARMTPDSWITPLVTSFVLVKRVTVAAVLLVVAFVLTMDGGAVAGRARAALDGLRADRTPAAVLPRVTVNGASSRGDPIRRIEWSPIRPPVLSRAVEAQVERAVSRLLDDRRTLTPFLPGRWWLRSAGGITLGVPVFVFDGEMDRVLVQVLVEDPFRPDEPPRVLNPERVGRAILQAYPRELRERGLGGTVGVEFLLDAAGNVEGTRVAQVSQYPALDRAALTVASQYRFAPAVHAGTPVASSARSAIAFRLP